MARFVNLLGPMGLDSTNCEVGEVSLVLIQSDKPQRFGDMRVGGNCAGGRPEGSASCCASDAPQPPEEGSSGINDIYLCC
jgi:hypothetical protein